MFEVLGGDGGGMMCHTPPTTTPKIEKKNFLSSKIMCQNYHNCFGTVLKLLLCITNYVAMSYESSIHMYVISVISYVLISDNIFT